MIYPPYGKQLMKMRRSGQIPARRIIIVFNWSLAKAYPRVVVPSDIQQEKLNFSYLAGLPVQIVYRSKDAHRVDSVVEEILKVHPSWLATFGLDLLDTDAARQIIISGHENQRVAA